MLPRGTLVAIFFVFLWASAYVPSKIASTQSPPLWFLVVRFAIAGLALAALALALRRPFPRTLGAYGIATLLGILANALYLGFTYTALQHLASGMGAIVASLNPLVLAVVAPKTLGERLDARKAGGLALGFGGVLAIVAFRAGTGTATTPDVLCAFAGVCASVASTVLYKPRRFQALVSNAQSRQSELRDDTRALARPPQRFGTTLALLTLLPRLRDDTRGPSG